MEKLHIDWDQERPNSQEIIKIWKLIRFNPINNLTDSTSNLLEKISFTHVNGGIQLHKFKILSNEQFEWFASRNRLEEIGFLKNVLKHNDLSAYRKNLKIDENPPEFRIIKTATDIYDLSGELARLLDYGGAYRNIDSQTAWKTASEFVNVEFQNRFEEFISYQIDIKSSNWFYNIAWDYSIIIFDKRNYELIFIDITDTD